MILTEDEVLMG